MDVCRVCLSDKPKKHLCQLTGGKTDNLRTYLNIFRFCLDIQVDENSKITSKLCCKCFKKLLTFYEFKSMALKNDSYLRTINCPGLNTCTKAEPIYEDEVLVELVTQNDSDCLKTGGVKSEEHEKIIEQKLDKENSSDFELDDNISYRQKCDDHINAENIKTKPPKAKSAKGIQIKSKCTNKSGPGICDQCGASVRNLKEHALKHIPKHQRKQYPCKLCEKIYIEPSALRRHNKRKHLGILSHCDICNKDVTSLKNHQLVKHNQATLPLQCAVCKLRFPTPSALDRHSTLHTDEKAFQCELCGKSFRLKLSLESHVRMVHNKERNYFCTICTKGFFKKYSLDIHMRTHTKEKPCKCAECHKSFACSSGLRNHMRCHSDVRAYHCTLCDKRFASASTLYMHKRAHRQERPYGCRHCDARYARTFDRNKHERNHHQHETQVDNYEKLNPPKPQSVI